MGEFPVLGVVFHWLGGLAAGSFYIPYRGVRRWSWETYWLAGGFFSWIIAPLVIATILVPDLWTILRAAPWRPLILAYIFGVMWGVGGLTFGLTMRYLGIALGMAVALGYCAAFGTLIPPIFKGEYGTIIRTISGHINLMGMVICLIGIAISGMAGMSKERELTDEQKRATIEEFSFVKGVLVATFSGIMSACFAFGLSAGKPIAEIARAELAAHGRFYLWENLPVLVVVLWGGFTTNFIWCVLLNLKNSTGGEYFRSQRRKDASRGDEEEDIADNGASPRRLAVASRRIQTERVPMLSNYLFCALAGTTWYMQFFFYSMGEIKMGRYGYSSWTIHMASIIIFSTLWGIALREWRGTSRFTHTLIALGLFLLIGSTLVVGYSKYLETLKL